MTELHDGHIASMRLHRTNAARQAYGWATFFSWQMWSLEWPRLREWMRCNNPTTPIA